MPTLAREFNISLSTVHDYIEEQRKFLRAQTIDLAAQEREQALVFLDTALEEVMPHISNGDAIKIQRVRRGARTPVIITMEAWEGQNEGLRGHGKASGPQGEAVGHGLPGQDRTTSDGSTRNRGAAGSRQGGAASMDPIRCSARGLPGERFRISQGSSIGARQHVILGRICTVVARARGSTTTPDNAGEASSSILRCA